MNQAQSGVAQGGRGQNHDTQITAMPNEALVVHVPDPEANRILKVNDIKETRYAKVISVGQPRGRHRTAPVAVGDVVLTKTATAGVAVPGMFHENKLVHRLDWADLLAVAEDYGHE
jgi:hypothetical protein